MIEGELAGRSQVVSMDVAGVDIVFVPQHGCAAQQALARCAPLAVGRIDARNAQDTHAQAAAQVTHHPFSIHPALGARGGGLQGACLIHQRPTAIAIHATGRAIDQGPGQAALPQAAGQRQAAGVAPPLTRGLRRRWCQVQNPVRQAGQAMQGRRLIQIPHQRRDALGAQAGHPGGRRGQRQHTHTPVQLARHALTDVTTAHDQQALAPEPRGQGAERALV